MTYKRFLRSRGIRDPQNPVLYITHGVVMCWLEPGFHMFWRKWNPPIGFLTYRLYALLRVKRQLRVPATLLVFMICGFCHDLVGIGIVGSLTPRSTLTFLSFGVLSLLSGALQEFLRQVEWPAAANAAVNGGLVWASFTAGSRANSFLLNGM